MLFKETQGVVVLIWGLVSDKERVSDQEIKPGLPLMLTRGLKQVSYYSGFL